MNYRAVVHEILQPLIPWFKSWDYTEYFSEKKRSISQFIEKYAWIHEQMGKRTYGQTKRGQNLIFLEKRKSTKNTFKCKTSQSNNHFLSLKKQTNKQTNTIYFMWQTKLINWYWRKLFIYHILNFYIFIFHFKLKIYCLEKVKATSIVLKLKLYKINV